MDELLIFAGKHPYMVGGAVLLTVFAIFNEVRQAARRGIDLGPGAAIGLINKGAAVIDLRGFERYKSGHIINARHIPMEELGEAASGKLKSAKDGPVIVYDDTGLGGARAASMLRKLDFANAINLRGGIAAWERENFPLEKRS